METGERSARASKSVPTIMLALEHPDQPIHSWFQQADHNVIQDVKRFLMEGGFVMLPIVKTRFFEE